MEKRSLRISVIICTYMRPEAIKVALASFSEQTFKPFEIIIVDGSNDNSTAQVVSTFSYPNLHYYKVAPDQLGLTKQRNFGITKVDPSAEVISFMDDDVALYTNYFENLATVFESDNSICGVGGVAVNEFTWEKNVTHLKTSAIHYVWEDFVTKEPLRNQLRFILGLQSPLPSGCLPEYGHGRTNGYPFTGKTYDVDILMGYSMAFKASIFDEIQFSTYFEGYGLYEDADFCIRAQKYGKIVVATSVLLNHYAAPSGRPNAFKYGQMVVRNGWYVWRKKFPTPSWKSRVKWNSITLLLAFLRGMNAIKGPNRRQALTDCLGRWVAWVTLGVKRPKG